MLVILASINFQIWKPSGDSAKIIALQKQIKEQSQLVAQLENRNSMLSQEVKYLKTNQDSIMEFYGRWNFGFVKKNEIFYGDIG